ncbi:hypothetical protein AK812_SmicGene45297, partial [Symbiodinium microadriaticum]
MPIGTSTYIVDCFVEALQTVLVGAIVSETSLVFLPTWGTIDGDLWVREIAYKCRLVYKGARDIGDSIAPYYWVLVLPDRFIDALIQGVMAEQETLSVLFWKPETTRAIGNMKSRSGTGGQLQWHNCSYISATYCGIITGEDGVVRLSAEELANAFALRLQVSLRQAIGGVLQDAFQTGPHVQQSSVRLDRGTARRRGDCDAQVIAQEQLLLRQQAQAAGTLEYPLNSAVQFPVQNLFLHRLHQGGPETIASTDNVGVVGEASGQVVPKPSFPPTPPQHLQQSEVELEPRFPPSPPQSLQESQVELEPRFPPIPPQQSMHFQPESGDWGLEAFGDLEESDWDGGGTGFQTDRTEQERSEVPSPSFSHVSEVGCEAEWYDRVRDMLNPQGSGTSDWGTDRSQQGEPEGSVGGPSIPPVVAEPSQPVLEDRAIE